MVLRVYDSTTPPWHYFGVRTLAWRLASTIVVVVAGCILAAGGVVAAVTPRLCARPVDVGSAVRDLVEDLDTLADARIPDDSRVPPRVVVQRVDSLEIAGGARAIAEPIERRLRRLSRKHSVRYSFHALLGSYLEGLACAPEAVGVQWYKAAFHASSAPEVDQAASGLSRATARLSDRAPFARALCGTAGRIRRPTVLEVMRRAGLACAPG